MFMLPLVFPALLAATSDIERYNHAKSKRFLLQKGSQRHRIHLGEDIGTETPAKVEHQKPSFCDNRDGFVKEWGDEFDGESLDTSAWEVIKSQENQGDHTAVVSGLGVTACRTAACRHENVRVSGGKLYLHSEREASKYFTGAITSKGKRSWADSPAYRMCVSAKLPGTPGPRGKGVWPAHWMLPDNGISDKCLDEGEMDIMEMINSDGGVYSTFHWLSSWPGRRCGDFDTFHKSQNRLTKMPSDWNTAFHEYAIERSPEHMAFVIDGQVALNVSADRVGAKLSHTPFFLILNTAIGGGWPGEPTAETALPAEHVIDYVRVSRQRPGADTKSDEATERGDRIPLSFAEVDSMKHIRHASPPPMSRMDI